MLTLLRKVKRIYIFTLKGKIVAMRSVPPTPNLTKEKVAKLVSPCSQFNRNSRKSFFEEGLI